MLNNKYFGTQAGFCVGRVYLILLEKTKGNILSMKNYKQMDSRKKYYRVHIFLVLQTLQSWKMFVFFYI